jgi:hypothetical protein
MKDAGFQKPKVVTPLEEDKPLCLSMWNACATSRISLNYSTMCNQDSPWRSSEEEEIPPVWSDADDEEQSNPWAASEYRFFDFRKYRVPPRFHPRLVRHGSTMTGCGSILAFRGTGCLVWGSSRRTRDETVGKASYAGPCPQPSPPRTTLELQLHILLIKWRQFLEREPWPRRIRSETTLLINQ